MRYIIRLSMGLLIGLVVIVSSVVALNSDTILEKPMVIITASYNNRDHYKRNLDSIFAQEYSNYSLIHWDDASTDGSGDLVAAYIKECGQEHRCMVIKNKERRGACANEYCAAHLCSDESIIIIVDGDDALARPDALKIVNSFYQDPQVWITYGQNEYSCGGIGQARELPIDCYVRHYSWVTTHLRTSYARLFKKVKLKDFFYESRFLTAACDLAQMFPMLDMAGNNTRFIDTVLYWYNVQTAIHDHVINRDYQIAMENYLRALPAYPRLNTLFDSERSSDISYQSLIIDSSDMRTVEEVLSQLISFDTPFIWIGNKYPDIHHDNVLSMSRCMKNTGAYAFYDNHSCVPTAECMVNELTSNDSNIRSLQAWHYGYNAMNYPHTLNALYRTEDIINFLNTISHELTLQEAINYWLEKEILLDEVGLCWGNPVSQSIEILI